MKQLTFTPILDKFCDFYRELDQRPLSELRDIYASDIEFQDPVHHVKGIDELVDYFTQSMDGVLACRFEIEAVNESDNEAFVRWTMHLKHPRLNAGQLIEVPGISHLRFAEMISYHRDYFDLGVMVYEHVPLLGRLIRGIKQRLA